MPGASHGPAVRSMVETYARGCVNCSNEVPPVETGRSIAASRNDAHAKRSVLDTRAGPSNDHAFDHAGDSLGADDAATRAGALAPGAPRAAPPRDASPRGRLSSDQVSGIMERIRGEVGDDQFHRFFGEKAQVRHGAEGLELTVRSEYLARILERRFGEQIRRAAAVHAPANAPPPVSIRVERAAPAEPSRPATVPAIAQPKRPRVGDAAFPARSSLAEFVVGAANQLAYHAALRAADDDAFRGSLFVHGPCGMGKTHLLQGVAARFLERRPDATVRYITGEAFMNEYVAAIRANRMEAFRKLYRRLDLLCLDDIHFFSNKDGTQAELLHTFDAITHDKARVVLASDEHPRDIAAFSEKLVSRFLSGAVVRLETPDAALRLRLVKSLAARRGLAIEDAAAALVAERSARSIGTLGGFGGSVREIDGLLIQVEAVTRLLPEHAGSGGSVGVLLVRQALGLADASRPAPPGRARRPLRIEDVTSEVCRALAVDLAELMGRGRHKRVVLARAACAHLARKLTTMSYPEIARGLGRPNHSTVITACKRLAAQLADGALAAKAMHDDVVLGLAPELRALSLHALIDALSDRVVRAAT